MALSAIAVAAETVTVSVDHVDLRSQKASMFPVVATAKNGDTLTVLEHADPWMKVQAGDTVGWIRSADLSTKSSSMNGMLSSANASMNGTTAGQASEGASAKGLNDGNVIDYAKSIGADPAKLDRLIALRKKLINDGTWVKFAKQGKVGAH